LIGPSPEIRDKQSSGYKGVSPGCTVLKERTK